MEYIKIFDAFNILDTPLLVINEDGQITWANQAAKMNVCSEFESDSWTNEYARLPLAYSYLFHKGIPDENSILVECIPSGHSEISEEIRTLQETNNELEELINSSLDEWYVTDGEGITIRMNERVEQLYGSLIGKSVFDIERQRIWYPSVSAMVLRHRSQQTILQYTNDGRRLLSTGIPIFNSDGSIKRVISFAKDVTELQLLTHKSHEPTETSDPVEAPRPFIANSPAMRRCMDMAGRVARTDVCVLLLGETGVGKNRVARYIHEVSKRQDGPFIEINCTSIPESLLESELFGYERGSFTGARREGKPGKVELAEGGTLFLNEIGELPLHLQGKLLDLLQERVISRIGSTRPIKVNLRVIAATNRNLWEMVKDGSFREDLYYRLNVVPITIPSLRERRDDIRPLVNAYLQRFAEKYQVGPHSLHSHAEFSLLTYQWPGNIRELENLLERLVITVDDEVIHPNHLPDYIREPMGAALRDIEHSDTTQVNINVKEQVSVSEREIYENAVKVCRSTREIAKRLQVSQSTVVRKLKQYHLSCRKEHNELFSLT